MLDLVGNPEDRFSSVAAHMKAVLYRAGECQQMQTLIKFVSCAIYLNLNCRDKEISFIVEARYFKP